MAEKLLPTQYVLNKCFNNSSLRVGLNTTQDYLNAVYDSSSDSLKVSMEEGDGVPYWQQPVATIGDLPSTARTGESRYVISESAYYTYTGTAWQISSSTGLSGAIYIGDSNTDGSWRIAINGGNLEIQKRESGSWVMKQTIVG